MYVHKSLPVRQSSTPGSGFHLPALPHTAIILSLPAQLKWITAPSVVLLYGSISTPPVVDGAEQLTDKESRVESCDQIGSHSTQ